MEEKLTASEWDEIFPRWPRRLSEATQVGNPFAYVEVFSGVFLRERWSGIVEPSERDRDEILFRAGRWYVIRDGITCSGAGYEISADDINREDWIAHLLEKSWLYDPTDMLDAFEAAREILFPSESVERRESVHERQLSVAIERGFFPFNSSRVLGKYVYLVSNMEDEERRVFCQFLSDKGLIPD